MAKIAAATETGEDSGTITRATAGRWAWIVATVLGIGRLRPGSGTWASIATVAVWRAIAPRLDPASLVPATIGSAAVAVALGIPAATRVARQLGDGDPSRVVIDEVAGQLIALVGVPVHWKTVLGSLILFRVFDILKPPPIRQLERLREGYGIVLDDVAAGLFALLVLQGVRYWGLLP